MAERKISEYDLVQLTATEDDGGIALFVIMVNGKIRGDWQPQGSIQSQMMVEGSGGLPGKAVGSKAIISVLWQPIVRHEDITDEERASSSRDHPLERKLDTIHKTFSDMEFHLRKFAGVPKAHFGLFLKECEWRFNNSDPSAQLTQLRQWVRRYLRWLSRTAPK
jgi:hypothetical protein